MDIFDNSLDEFRAATRANIAQHPLHAKPLPHGQTLPFSLHRQLPRAAESIGYIMAGLAIAVVGSAGFIWTFAYVWSTGNFDEWLILGIMLAAIVAGLGYKFLGHGIYVMLGSRTPLPTVEIDRNQLRPDEAFRLLLIQPGPCSLNKIEVDLAGKEKICEEKQNHNAKEDPGTYTVWSDRNTFLRILFEEENVRVRRGETFRREIKFRVPDDVMPTGGSEKHSSYWNVVVELDVHFGADCTHEFPVFMQQRLG